MRTMRRGSSDADAQILLLLKTLRFLLHMVCTHGQREEGQHLQFCADVFYGQPLKMSCEFAVESIICR